MIGIWKQTIFLQNWYHRGGLPSSGTPVGPIISLTFFPEGPNCVAESDTILSSPSRAKCHEGGPAGSVGEAQCWQPLALFPGVPAVICGVIHSWVCFCSSPGPHRPSSSPCSPPLPRWRMLTTDPANLLTLMESLPCVDYWVRPQGCKPPKAAPPAALPEGLALDPRAGQIQAGQQKLLGPGLPWWFNG